MANLTFAEQNQQKIKAQLEGTEAPSVQESNIHAQMAAVMRVYKQRLSNIQSMQKKKELKSKLIFDFASYEDGCLTAPNPPKQNDLLMLLMLWHIDLGQIERGVELGKFGLSWGYAMPAGHSRTLACALVEETATFYLTAGKYAMPDIKHLLEVEYLTDGMDMPDEVLAKLNKAIGKIYDQAQQSAQALKYYLKALDLNINSGVKSRIKQLQKQL